MPSPPVRAPNRTTLLPGPVGLRELDAVGAQHADAQRVDQRVAGVAVVEDDLAADVRQAEAVAVAADAGDHAGQHPRGVRRVERAEAQRVQHGDRPCAHRQDVADDAADAGGRTLVRLDVGRVVVRLDLEGDRPAVADVDHAGVLAHADEQHARRVGRGLLGELAQVHLRGLVRAVLAPHDRVDRQLGAGGPAAEDLTDLQVLLVVSPELGVGLRLLGGSGRLPDRVGHAATVIPAPRRTRCPRRRRRGRSPDRRCPGR